MSQKSKYKKKYSTMLLDGLRSDGKSVIECCLAFGISAKTYYNWIKEHEEFAHAADIGDMQCAEWWHKNQRSVASGDSAGNAAVINFAMKNVDKIKWLDKSEVHTTHTEQIHTLVIKTIPPFVENRIIEHEQTVRNLPDPESE